jgi:tRNA-Thr(GGU) m(6)t(6)A37 methyltransferase TsaA
MESRESQNTSFEFDAIGVFKGASVRRYEAPRQSAMQDQRGVVHLKPKMGFEQALEDLQGFDRLWLIYVFHHNTSHWKPKVHTPRSVDGVKKGVFATRAPYRPNPIGMSCVKLLDFKGLKLYVGECDLLDDSPILDIKPYIPYADSFPEAQTGWLEAAAQLNYILEYEAAAEIQVAWIEKATGLKLRDYLVRNLEFQPLNTRHKRVRALGQSQEYSLALQTWRVRFHLDETQRKIRILGCYPGYSWEQLIREGQDVHREFVQEFQLKINAEMDWNAQEIKP